MKRKVSTILSVLTILLCMGVYNYKKATTYDRVVKASPKQITCPYEITQTVTLLSEYTVIVSEDRTGTRGIASFETNGKIYLLGHSTEEPVGSLAFKVEKSNNEIAVSNLMGEVISNEENGVIVEQYQSTEGYDVTIPVSTTAQLGEAFAIKRDEAGNLCQYSITIEAFEEEEGVFFYSSSETSLEQGTSGMPIIQNGKLIGIHYGTIENGKGIGRIIWSLDIILC